MAPPRRPRRPDSRHYVPGTTHRVRIGAPEVGIEVEAPRINVTREDGTRTRVPGHEIDIRLHGEGGDRRPEVRFEDHAARGNEPARRFVVFEVPGFGDRAAGVLKLPVHDFVEGKIPQRYQQIIGEFFRAQGLEPPRIGFLDEHRAPAPYDKELAYRKDFVKRYEAGIEHLEGFIKELKTKKITSKDINRFLRNQIQGVLKGIWIKTFLNFLWSPRVHIGNTHVGRVFRIGSLQFELNRQRKELAGLEGKLRFFESNDGRNFWEQEYAKIKGVEGKESRTLEPLTRYLGRTEDAAYAAWRRAA